MTSVSPASANQGAPSGAFPGFDGIRLLASISVLFSHAYLIAEGSEVGEPFVRLLGKGNILGHYGVFTFFIISGFLLTRSLSRNSDPLSFTWHRVLRIVPGFLFCVAVTALVFGPLVTNQPLGAYLQQPVTYRYITSALGCVCDFWEPPFSWPVSTSYATTLNGSLWSLSYEVLSYVFLLWLWMLLRTPTRVAITSFVTAITMLAITPAAKLLPGIAYTLPYFAAGSVMFLVHRRFGVNALGACIAALGLVVASFFHFQTHAFIGFGAYLVVFFAERSNPGSVLAHRVGDLSYGMYLFGWPVEQYVQLLTGTQSGEALFAYSLLPTMGLAAVSWWAVERPFMKCKDALRALRSRLSAGSRAGIPTVRSG